MAGHSHAANVARRKNAVDAKRAQIFSKCAKAIMSAVRQGGPDPDANLKLRYAVEKARAENMPKENIERAIKRASGEGMGDLEELNYEGYAQGGVAAVLDQENDSFASHIQDTVDVGAGICHPETVEHVIRRGPEAIPPTRLARVPCGRRVEKS